MEASSSTKGFFQVKPVIPPQFLEDRALQRVVSLYLPTPIPKSISDDYLRFSHLVLSKPILNYIADAEKNTPSVKSHSSFGVENREDPLVTTEGWRELQNIGIREGIVALAYEGSKDKWNHRIHQYVKYHIWSGSSAIVTCPSAMTDGAAKLLGRHVNEEHGQVFAQARAKLISRESGVAWTSGQWMTERKGGSDVRGTETIATKLTSADETDGVDADGVPLGPWKIDGFKWFSSATDANMTILLAKTGKDGQISAFYAPLRRRVRGGGAADGETELNGIRIQRLKNKLGTKTLPTAELELKGMRGYLLGKEGQGVKEISTILNITRMHNIVSAVGAWGRGLAISRAFARVRTAGGKPLYDLPAHVRGLAQEHVKYWAHMQLAYFIAALLGRSEGFSPSNDTSAARSYILPESVEEVNALYRVLTPLAKAQTALSAIHGLRACMESLGGVGYLENEDPELNIARIFRDTNVLAIWEGTTDIMADDLVRSIRGAGGAQVLTSLKKWLDNAVAVAKKSGFEEQSSILQSKSDKILSDFATKDKEELKFRGRDYLRELDFLVSGSLLILDAARDQDAVAREIALRWIHAGSSSRSWKEAAAWDKKIVFGDEVLQAKL